MAFPNNRWLITTIARTHTFVYRLTGGALASRYGRLPFLLLTTTGRRSGRPRVTPLLYFEDGSDTIVVASNGGDDRNPEWLKNLRRNPEAAVQIKREVKPVRAEVAGSEERSRLWPSLVAVYPHYDEYVKRTRREIPVVILRPR